MISGSKDVVNLFLEDVGDSPIESNLMAPQVELIVPAISGEILLGGAVVESLALELRKGSLRHAPKRSSHGGAGRALGDLPMTTGAYGRVNVSSIGAGGQDALRLAVA
jgi:hypothetical protein